MRFSSSVATVTAAMLCFSAGSDATAAPHTHQEQRLQEIARLYTGEAIQVAPQPVPCTLSGGAKTFCASISVIRLEPEHELGPWCPRNIADGPEKAGIWIDGGKVYDADGSFIRQLPMFYQDASWQMFDKTTGRVNVTDTREACLAAARPDVDPKYRNYCVECSPSHVDPSEKRTYLIPLEPAVLDTQQQGGPHTGVGLSLNGVMFDAPAPLHAILGAHTLAPFDDCGGHVNPHAGYHYHAVTDCAKAIEPDHGHASLIGVAMDGFALYRRLDAKGGAE